MPLDLLQVKLYAGDSVVYVQAFTCDAVTSITPDAESE